MIDLRTNDDGHGKDTGLLPNTTKTCIQINQDLLDGILDYCSHASLGNFAQTCKLYHESVRTHWSRRIRTERKELLERQARFQTRRQQWRETRRALSAADKQDLDSELSHVFFHSWDQVTSSSEPFSPLPEASLQLRRLVDLGAKTTRFNYSHTARFTNYAHTLGWFLALASDESFVEGFQALVEEDVYAEDEQEEDGTNWRVRCGECSVAWRTCQLYAGGMNDHATAPEIIGAVVTGHCPWKAARLGGSRMRSALELLETFHLAGFRWHSGQWGTVLEEADEGLQMPFPLPTLHTNSCAEGVRLLVGFALRSMDEKGPSVLVHVLYLLRWTLTLFDKESALGTSAMVLNFLQGLDSSAAGREPTMSVMDWTRKNWMKPFFSSKQARQVLCNVFKRSKLLRDTVFKDQRNRQLLFFLLEKRERGPLVLLLTIRSLEDPNLSIQHLVDNTGRTLLQRLGRARGPTYRMERELLWLITSQNGHQLAKLDIS